MEYWDREIGFRDEFNNRSKKVRFREEYRAAIQALKGLQDTELEFEFHIQSNTNIALAIGKSVAEQVEELGRAAHSQTQIVLTTVRVRLLEVEVWIPEEYWEQRLR